MAENREALVRKYAEARVKLDTQIDRALSNNSGAFVPFAFDAAIAAAMDLMLSGLDQLSSAVASYVATAELDRQEAALERLAAKADRESQERNRESMKRATWMTGIFTVVIAIATAASIMRSTNPIALPAPVVNVAAPAPVVVPAPVVNVTIPAASRAK